MWSHQMASAKSSSKAHYQGKEERQNRRWEDNINRQRWQNIVTDVSSGTLITLVVPGHGMFMTQFCEPF